MLPGSLLSTLAGCIFGTPHASVLSVSGVRIRARPPDPSRISKTGRKGGTPSPSPAAAAAAAAAATAQTSPAAPADADPPHAPQHLHPHASGHAHAAGPSRLHSTLSRRCTPSTAPPHGTPAAAAAATAAPWPPRLPSFLVRLLPALAVRLDAVQLEVEGLGLRLTLPGVTLDSATVAASAAALHGGAPTGGHAAQHGGEAALPPAALTTLLVQPISVELLPLLVGAPADGGLACSW